MREKDWALIQTQTQRVCSLTTEVDGRICRRRHPHSPDFITFFVPPPESTLDSQLSFSGRVSGVSRLESGQQERQKRGKGAVWQRRQDRRTLITKGLADEKTVSAAAAAGI